MKTVEYHNPDNVPAELLPKGYRFLTKEEFQNNSRLPEARLYLRKGRWKVAIQDRQAPYASEYTYCVPGDMFSTDAQRIKASIGALCVVSIKIGGAPHPHHVEAEMKTLVASVRADANTEVERLKAELLDARRGCQRLKNENDQLGKELDQAREGREDALRRWAEAEDKARKMKANVSGNAVLVRRDGFSRPVTISPTPSYDGYRLPPHLKSSIQTSTYRQTPHKDGFGRVIFEQVR